MLTEILLGLLYERKCFWGRNNSRNDPENLDLYFQCCSMLINSKMGAVMSATLANGGVWSDNKEVLVKKQLEIVYYNVWLYM